MLLSSNSIYAQLLPDERKSISNWLHNHQEQDKPFTDQKVSVKSWLPSSVLQAIKNNREVLKNCFA